MTHTPTPIECRGFTEQYGYTLTDFNGVVFARVNHGNNGSTAEENRDFVIRACNAHADLVAALNGCAAFLTSMGGDKTLKTSCPDLTTLCDEYADHARAALAKAKP